VVFSIENLGSMLNGAGVFILAMIALYNLWTARGHAKVIENLEKNTNSIKDALIKVVGESEHAKGVIIGKAEAADVGKAVAETLHDMQEKKE